MKQSRNLTILIILVTLAVMINIVMGIRQVEYQGEIQHKIINVTIPPEFSQKNVIDLKACPAAVGGNKESYLHMKYFYTDYCPWCKKEEAVLKDLLVEQGDLFFVEWYNLAYCKEIANTYKVSGVPTFVFSATDNVTEYPKYGYIPHKDFKKFICSVSGGC